MKFDPTETIDGMPLIQVRDFLRERGGISRAPSTRRMSPLFSVCAVPRRGGG
jgi:hypothetical protein